MCIRWSVVVTKIFRIFQSKELYKIANWLKICSSTIRWHNFNIAPFSLRLNSKCVFLHACLPLCRNKLEKCYIDCLQRGEKHCFTFVYTFPFTYWIGLMEVSARVRANVSFYLDWTGVLNVLFAFHCLLLKHLVFLQLIN